MRLRSVELSTKEKSTKQKDISTISYILKLIVDILYFNKLAKFTYFVGDLDLLIGFV